MKVFYALFFEHTINRIIHHVCTETLRVFPKTAIEVIKLPLHAKLTWVPELLGLKKFKESHVNVIKKVADDRNAFLHYKWIGETYAASKLGKRAAKRKKQLDQIEKELVVIKKAMKYTRYIEAHAIYGGRKGTIDGKFKKLQIVE